MRVRKQIAVSGIVQGVGFRPYVYRLASERHLRGSVCNTAAGVIIEVQGPDEAVNDFVTLLPLEAPPLARITGITVGELPCNGDQSFRIVASRRQQDVQALISPDVAICPDCLRELFDPGDAATSIPSSTALTADRGSPLCAAYPMTGRSPRWPLSPCVRPA